MQGCVTISYLREAEFIKNISKYFFSYEQVAASWQIDLDGVQFKGEF